MKGARSGASMARSLFLWLLFACASIWVALYLFGIYLTQSAGGSFDQNVEHLANLAVTNTERRPGYAPEETWSMLSLFLGFRRDAESNGAPAFLLRTRDAARMVRFISSAPDPFENIDLPSGWSDQEWSDTRYRVLTRQLPDGGELVIAQSRGSRWRAYNHVMLSQDTLIKPFLVGFLILLLVVMMAVRQALRPLYRLSAELSARAPGDLRHLETKSLQAELKPIILAFNTALDRLDRMRDGEQRFLADAAHELRTPMAVIAAQSEAIFSATDPTERNQAILRLRRSIDRANRLIGQLLALARLEATGPSPGILVDLVEMAAELLAGADADAAERDIELSLYAPNAMQTWMQAEHFDMLLGNLVGNAIRHHTGGGRIEVRLHCVDKQICLTVSDDGPGIPQEQHSMVLRRFHRLQPQSGMGSGLGLAIVAEVVEQLSGQLQLAAGLNGRGLGVSVTFPRQGPP
jgi:two-component system, OmpR family, sensor histidine kinase QseC